MLPKSNIKVSNI